MHRKLILLAALSILATVLCSTASSAADSNWPMFKQNPLRTGVDLGSGTIPLSGGIRPTPMWVFPQFPLDNSDSSFIAIGTWNASNGITGEMATGAFGSNYAWVQAASSATVSAIWTFTMVVGSAGGDYYPEVWFPSYVSGLTGPESGMTRSTDVQYSVRVDGTLAGSYVVDQTTGGKWISLGGSALHLAAGKRVVTITVTNQSASTASPMPIVVADAARVVPFHSGLVVSSPVVARRYDAGSVAHPVIVDAVTTRKPLPTSTGQDATTTCAEIYGLYAENDGDNAAVDPYQRSSEAWRFPSTTHNWIGGGVSSTPTIVEATATTPEMAIIPCMDGQVYAIKTSDGSLVWQGPGYYLWDPTTTSGTATWAVGAHDGYQRDPAGSDTYLTTPAVLGSATGTTVWTPSSLSGGTYSIYAWIPPSVGAEQQYISDATYEVSWQGGSKLSYKISQANGGRWVKICQLPQLNATQLSALKIELLNNTSNLMADGSSYVAADAIRIVPSDIAAFDFSSALTYYDSTATVPTLTAYVGNTNGRLYALNIGSPDPVWVYPKTNASGLGAMYASPTFDNAANPTLIYIGTADGHVYAVNADGTLKWAYPLLGNDTNGKYYSLGQISSTSVLGNYLYVSTSGSTGYGFAFNPCGRVLALDTTLASTVGTSAANSGAGRDIWWFPATTSSPVGGFMYSSPLLIDLSPAPGTPALVAGSTDGTLYELNPATGVPLNTTLPLFNTASTSASFANVGGTIYSSPAGLTSVYPDANTVTMNHEVAYFGSGNLSTNSGQIYGVDLCTGAKDWWMDLPGAVISSPALHNSRIYVGDTAGYMWAFGTNIGDGWCSNSGTEPTVSSSETSGVNPRTANGEVEIYTKAQFDAIMKAISDSYTSRTPIDATYDDLHSLYSTATTYEWGEQLYVIAWNLLNPNYDRPSKSNGDYTSPTYKSSTDSTVSLIFKSHDPGDNSDAESTQTMVSGDYEYATGQKVLRQGFFVDKNNQAVYYSIGTFAVDGTTGGWLPGTNIAVTMRERPANNADAGSDVYMPNEHPVPTKTDGTADHSRYTPRYVTVNNPLGLVYSGATTMLVGMDSVSTSSKSSPLAGTNGNHNLMTDMPVVQPTLTSAHDAIIPHGTTSYPEVVTVCDRSLLGQINKTLSNVKSEPVDVEWAGGQAAIVAANGEASGAGTSVSTYLPWEVLPNELSGQVNSSPDYPDISAKRFSCVQEGTGLDVTVGSLSLPATPSAAGTSPWAAGQAGVDISLSVPQFQPANDSGVTPDLGTKGYLGKTYVYLDTNGDNLLEKSGTLGLTSIIQKSTGASAEPYREFLFNARVPMDRRVQIDETSIDLGTVPQGFGLSSVSGDGTPIPFDGPSLTLSSLWSSSAWAPFFKPFTAHNLGNVNMVNLKVAKRVFRSGASAEDDLFLTSDNVLDNPLTSSGHIFGLNARGLEDYSDPNAAYPWLTTSADTRFKTETHPAGYGVTFQKPMIGSQGRMLTIPEVNSAMSNPQRPLLSLAVPVGQPVGTYTGAFTIYEDVSPTHQNVYDEDTPQPIPALAGVRVPIDYAGDPVLKVSVTVGEAQITNKSATVGIGNSAPHLDDASTAVKTGGNMFPAAWVDPTNGYTYLFMSSDRGNAANLLSAPWYLWGTHLTTVGKAVNPYEVIFGTASGSPDKSWLRPAASFPDIAQVNTSSTGLFPTSTQSPGQIKDDTAKFMYPSGAVDTTANKAWLFFTGQVTKYLSSNPDVYVPGGTKSGQSLIGTGAETIENRAFFTEVTGGNPGTIEPITSDWGSAKYGLRGMATQLGSNYPNLAGNYLNLWGWWYGGGNNKWRIFYNYRDMSDPTDGWGDTGTITSHHVAQLPMLPGLTSVAEPSPIFRKNLGGRLDAMEVLYSGFSTFHKTSDIYLTRYDVDRSATSKTSLQAISRGDVKTVAALSLPAIVGETLSRAPATRTWWSQHVDWDITATTTLIIQYSDNTASPGVTKTLTLTAGTPDPTSGMLLFTDSATNTAAAADPIAGSVKLVRLPNNVGTTPNLVMYLNYTPRSYRLTTGPGTNVSPFALLDTDQNPRYNSAYVQGTKNPFYVPTGWSPTSTLRRDRLWLFWRKAGDAKSGAGVVYKTFRHTVQLNYQLSATGVSTVSVGGVSTPVEVDWMKNRLYFMSDEDGKQVTITYTDINSTVRTDTLTVQLKEEPITETRHEVESDVAARLAFYNSQGVWPQTGPTSTVPASNVTRVMVNEGQVSAVKDPREDKVWVFWSSTRSGSTDVFYEVISPRFYGTETDL